jgi:hypothetical protein
MDTALDCEYIDLSYFNEMIKKIKSAIRLLNGYIKYLKKRKDDNA